MTYPVSHFLEPDQISALTRCGVSVRAIVSGVEITFPSSDSYARFLKKAESDKALGSLAMGARRNFTVGYSFAPSASNIVPFPTVS